MDFSEALTALKAGKRVRRAAWNEGGILLDLYVELLEPTLPDGTALMPQLLIGRPGDVMRPFAGAQWDLLADDWEIVA